MAHRSPSLLLALLTSVSVGGFARPATALPPDMRERLVSSARELVGVPYDLGGRLQGTRGTDCQGLLFYAAERIARCGWRSFSVFPTRSIPSGELGAPVHGGGPVATAEIDLSRLEAGDVLWLVGSAVNPAEPAIGELPSGPVWVWHTALYTGGGWFVHADFFTGIVVEEPLLPYLQAHPDSFEGVLVTRMTDGPAPARCRRHAPMTRRD